MLVEWIDVTTPAVRLRALTWGPPDAPMALCLHGFPDTAHGFRLLAPHLVEAGYRVVAPFMRGYAPSSLPRDHSFHIGALMDDALRVRDAAGPSHDDVVIGHDWGAVVATGLAALPDSPFRKAVVMSVPPASALWHGRGWDMVTLLPEQLVRSWYIGYFQLPLVPDRFGPAIVPSLWRRWSPGYDAAEDLAYVRSAIGSRDLWSAALGPYRATVRNRRPPDRYAELHRWWTQPPRLPTLYLHGGDDGCMSAEFAAFVRPSLPKGSDVAVVPGAGHFLQHQQPDEVGRRIVDFVKVATGRLGGVHRDNLGL
ncbi:MAG: alpha/beta fold hydrolase [Mycobacterium sp.]|nr:alpha/beta fold hydrolase [Mycobacterium sp.]